jgi:hypothetical protein
MKQISDEERIARLERKGIIRRGEGNMLDWLKTRRIIRSKTSLVEAILEERKSGR